MGEKIKRPVGRPRKDGLPAGSVGTRRSASSRKSTVKVHAESAQGPPGVPFPGVSAVVAASYFTFSVLFTRHIILSILEFPVGKQGSPRWVLRRLSRLRHSLFPTAPLAIISTTLIPTSTGMSGQNYCGQSLTRSYSPCSQLWLLRTRFQVLVRRLRTPSNPILVRWPHPPIKLKTLILYPHCTRFSKLSGFHLPRRTFPLSPLVRTLVPSLSIDSFTGIHSHLYSMVSHALPVRRCLRTAGVSNPGRLRFTILKSLFSSSAVNTSAKAPPVFQARQETAVNSQARTHRLCKPSRRGSRKSFPRSYSRVTPTWEAGRVFGTGMRWVFQNLSGTWSGAV